MWSGELYVVRGHSMSPAFLPGDGLFVSRTRSPATDVSRGDVVVVRGTSGGERQELKRVIGLPGECIRQSGGVLLVNGRRMVEHYLAGLPAVIGLEEDVWTLGDDECFVLGDNRAHSTDSRQFGSVSLDRIGGIVRFRCWPMHRIGRVRRPAYAGASLSD